MARLTIKPNASPEFWNQEKTVISDRGWSKEGFMWNTDAPLHSQGGPGRKWAYTLKAGEKLIPAVLYVRSSGSIYKEDIGFTALGGTYRFLGVLRVNRGRVPKPVYRSDGKRVVPFSAFLPEARQDFLSVARECIEVGPDTALDESSDVEAFIRAAHPADPELASHLADAADLRLEWILG